MPFYSFKVRSESEVTLPEYLVTLGDGIDVFNAQVENLENFVKALRALGCVTLLEVYQLDDFETVIPLPEIQAGFLGKAPQELVENS